MLRSLRPGCELTQQVGEEVLDLIVGRKFQFVAQTAAFVVERTDIPVVVHIADGLLQKSEAEQTAKDEIVFRQLGIVGLQIVDHTVVFAVDHILQIGERMP